MSDQNVEVLEKKMHEIADRICFGKRHETWWILNGGLREMADWQHSRDREEIERLRRFVDLTWEIIDVPEQHQDDDWYAKRSQLVELGREIDETLAPQETKR